MIAGKFGGQKIWRIVLKIEDPDHTVMIVFVHSHLSAETHPGGKVVSAVIILCPPFGLHCPLDSNSMVIT